MTSSWNIAKFEFYLNSFKNAHHFYVTWNDERFDILPCGQRNTIIPMRTSEGINHGIVIPGSRIANKEISKLDDQLVQMYKENGKV